ncbi:MAG: HD domain-containing protein [Desulfovibrionaceae bacterium]|nr:HD domain-containing protein [Desulfovibrionaceae bacterium]
MLESFPKYRLPLPVFRYRDDVAQLQMFIARDQRMSNEQVEEVHNLAREGDLFVSRVDYPIYSKHIIKQLDLILSDRNLKEGEIAYICVEALNARLKDYLDQPVKIVADKLYADTLVLTEYLMADPYRIKTFLNRLSREHSLAAHSVNTMIIGLWMLFNSKKDEKAVERKELDRYALALLMHDAGMSKVPSFILQKTTPLKPEEKDKITQHALMGAKMVQKLDLGWDELVQAAFEHHERMDGSGYPRKLKGDQISKIGRICAIADSFCAMIAARPYAEAKEPLAASQEIAADARYDPRYSSLIRNALITQEIALKAPEKAG